jgi:hypothetical protein
MHPLINIPITAFSGETIVSKQKRKTFRRLHKDLAYDYCIMQNEVPPGIMYGLKRPICFLQESTCIMHRRHDHHEET